MVRGRYIRAGLDLDSAAGAPMPPRWYTETKVREYSATELYETIVNRRFPVITERCGSGPDRIKSPPIPHEQSSSSHQLRLLAARWNKYWVTQERIDDRVCSDYTLLKMNVHNPRTRLWGAAVAAALGTYNEISKDELARFDDARECALFVSASNPAKTVAVYTANDSDGRHSRERWMAKRASDDAAFYVDVQMRMPGRGGGRVTRDDVAEFYDKEHELKVKVYVFRIR